MDNIALVASSTSLKKNTKALEREVHRLHKLGSELAIEFDLAKTELIYFTKGKKASTISLNLINNQGIIELKELVK